MHKDYSVEQNTAKKEGISISLLKNIANVFLSLTSVLQTSVMHLESGIDIIVEKMRRREL